MEDIVLLNIEGTPRPQPRPRLCRGRVVSTADANARRWKDSIQAAGKMAAEARGMVEAGAVAVVMRFDMPTPKAGRHGLPHTFRPDADNLAKLALDAVMDAGLLKDDAAVSTLVVTKTWAAKGGLVMTLHADDRKVSPVPADRFPDWIQ
jgi:Holliday junction resolvase RusA-like endonuclease